MQCDSDFDTEAEKASVLSSKATITLYSLAYESRDDGGDQYGVLYSGLTQCTKAFEHTLEADPQLDQEVSPVNLTTIWRKRYLNNEREN